MISAEEAIERLKRGNEQYVSIDTFHADVSPTTLEHFANNGQEPYAIIIGCSDSRVIPERIFHAAIGDLFTIRVAGNVIDVSTLKRTIAELKLKLRSLSIV